MDLGEYLIGAFEGAMNKVGGALEGIGNAGINLVNNIGGAIFDRGASTTSLGGDSIASEPMVVRPTTTAAADTSLSISQALAQPGNTISAAIDAVRGHATELAKSMQDFGKGTQYLAGADLPNVQAGLPFGISQAAGRSV